MGLITASNKASYQRYFVWLLSHAAEWTCYHYATEKEARAKIWALTNTTQGNKYISIMLSEAIEVWGAIGIR